jgi:hypothetical protein
MNEVMRILDRVHQAPSTDRRGRMARVSERQTNLVQAEELDMSGLGSTPNNCWALAVIAILRMAGKSSRLQKRYELLSVKYGSCLPLAINEPAVLYGKNQ